MATPPSPPRTTDLADRFKLGASPRQSIMLGFGLLGVAGWLTLSLPGATNGAPAGDPPADWLDHLFTVVSALSTTGLTTVTFADTYTWFGQWVVLLLIQLGGLGYLLLVTYYAAKTFRSGEESARELLGDKLDEGDDLSPFDFLRQVGTFVFVCEASGVALLTTGFYGSGQTFGEALFNATFHSVSGFCTAGFSTFPDNLEAYSDTPLVSLTTLSLSVAGSMGFLVIAEVRSRLLGGLKSMDQRTKAILLAFGGILSAATLLGWLFDAGVAGADRPVLAALYTAGSALTTVGFNVVPTDEIGSGFSMLLLFAMFCGAVSSGTGGGVKLTHFVTVTAIVWARLHARPLPTINGEVIDKRRSYISTSAFALYLAILFFGATALLFTEPASPFEDVLFEATSALGTVGLSRGLTAGLSEAGKVIAMVLMFCGRIGVLAFAFAFVPDAGDEDGSSER